MMKHALLSLSGTALMIGVLHSAAFTQDRIDWSADRPLTPAEFQGAAPTITASGAQECNCDVHIEMAHQMLIGEAAVTKHFNSYVSAYFTPGSSWVSAGEGSDRMVRYCQVQFDLVEWHARILRERLLDNVAPGSDWDLLKPHFDAVKAELNANTAKIQSAYEAAHTPEQQEAVILHWHGIVDDGIAELPDHCKSCEPVKAGKSRKL